MSADLRCKLADKVEPRIPWRSYFEARIRWQMRGVHKFERELQARGTDSAWLSNYETRRFSQNGEDGIIAEICRRLSISRGFFVEIGASDGSENCTRALVEDGWSGLWVEGDELRAKDASAVVASKPVAVANAFVTRDNIVELLHSNNVPRELDLLVLDIDGNDWWVLHSLLSEFKPKAIALEYNAAMNLRKWVLPYNPQHEWQHDRWHGASLRSFSALLEKHGMKLVGTDSTGVNAFYVRSEHAHLFPHPGDVRVHYSPPRHLLPFGHPWKQDNTTVAPLSEEAATRISILWATPLTSGIGTGFVDVLVNIRNDSTETIASSGDNPVHLAAWTGSREDSEPPRFRLLWPIPPGTTRPVFARVPEEEDVTMIKLDLVQEGVRWIGDSHEGSPLAIVDF